MQPAQPACPQLAVFPNIVGIALAVYVFQEEPVEIRVAFHESVEVERLNWQARKDLLIGRAFEQRNGSLAIFGHNGGASRADAHQLVDLGLVVPLQEHDLLGLDALRLEPAPRPNSRMFQQVRLKDLEKALLRHGWRSGNRD